MVKKFYLNIFIICLATLISLPLAIAGGPKGAKAIFGSGEGPSVGISVQPQKPSREEPVKKEKYIGISYQIVLLSDEGQFRIVPKSRVFKSGERIKLLVRTNRPGYMTILNVGPTGNTHVLFNDSVGAFTLHEIPKNTNLKFVGEPGTERVLIMLSNEPNPIVTQPTITATPVAPQPSYTPSPSPTTPLPSAESVPPPPSTPPTTPSDVTTLPPPPPVQTMVASIEGAKSIKGAKDIVAEDSMHTSYTVISPKNNYKPVKAGMKDIVLESSGGNNYGVIPVSAIADGGILTLEVKLQHR